MEIDHIIHNSYNISIVEEHTHQNSSSTCIENLRLTLSKILKTLLKIVLLHYISKLLNNPIFRTSPYYGIVS